MFECYGGRNYITISAAAAAAAAAAGKAIKRPKINLDHQVAFVDGQHSVMVLEVSTSCGQISIFFIKVVDKSIQRILV